MGISIWQVLIVLVIVVLLFGTKKLKNVGTDLGGALKGFKKAMSEEDEKSELGAAQSKDADFEAVENKTETVHTQDQNVNQKVSKD